MGLPKDAANWALQSARISHPKLGRVPFRDVARGYQLDLLRDLSDRVIIVKARQIGISQTLAFIAAYEALRGGTVVVVSRTGEQAALFLDYVYTALGDAPRPQFLTENQRSLELTSGGRVITQGATQGAGRGIPASMLMLDEMAWMEYGEDIYTSAMPTLSLGGRAFICSTPNGRGNAFYRLWAGAGEDWSRHNLPWHVYDAWRNDPAWEERQRANLTIEAFAQEYDCDFAASGGTVFAQSDIDALFCLPALIPPQPGHLYLSAWDLGRKQDATVGITFDTTAQPYRIVAYERLQHASYPEQTARIEARHAQYRGRTVVESNGVGDPVIQFLTVKVEEFTTTARTKKDAIDALQLLLQRRRLLAPPIPQLQRELELYQREDQGLVQDTVMALAIGAKTLLTGRPFTPIAGGYREPFVVR